jgi:hypothetical protein
VGKLGRRYVVDGNDVADRVGCVESPGCVGDDHDGDAEEFADAGSVGDDGHIVPFIEAILTVIKSVLFRLWHGAGAY